MQKTIALRELPLSSRQNIHPLISLEFPFHKADESLVASSLLWGLVEEFREYSTTELFELSSLGRMREFFSYHPNQDTLTLTDTLLHQELTDKTWALLISSFGHEFGFDVTLKGQFRLSPFLKIPQKTVSPWVNNLLIDPFNQLSQGINQGEKWMETEFSVSYFNMGQKYITNWQIKQAMDNFEIGLELIPNDLTTILLPGIGYLHQDNVKAALNSFERAISVDPDLFYSWHQKGMAEKQLGNRFDSIKSFLQSLRRNPIHWNSWKQICTS